MGMADICQVLEQQTHDLTHILDKSLYHEANTPLHQILPFQCERQTCPIPDL